MRKLILALGLLSLLAACSMHEDLPVERVGVGDQLPVFTVVMHDGHVESSASLMGHQVVLVFFSTQCGDCQRELPELQRLYDMLPDTSAVKMIAISRAEGDSIVRSYWAEHSLSIPYSAQPDRRIYELFASSIVPRIYVADKQGRVVGVYRDNPMPTAEEILEVLGF